jgi:threonine dehydrogenase-like Zn-dependent dehydrogenase
MRAFVITGPYSGEIQEVAEPVAAAGQVVVAVERAGVCGTDRELFSGRMSYLHTGQARYPLRIGHEWAGTVVEVGPSVDEDWLGRRVTGDTMLGCRSCDRCRRGRQHLCAQRYEIGVSGGWPGALAERLPVPVTALEPLPDHLPPEVGALVEPAGNALRAVRAAGRAPGERLLVVGPGAIGLLVAMIAVAEGLEVHLLGASDESLEFARGLGLSHAWQRADLPALAWDAVVEASTDASMPSRAVELVEPGGDVVFIGLSEEPSLVDSRVVALKDVRITGILSGSGGLRAAIAHFADGSVDPRPLVAATVGLDELPAVLRGERGPGWGAAPKIHVDPRR